MSFTEVFVSRWPKKEILTVEPDWTGNDDSLDFDAELHKETTPSFLFQLTDQVSPWKSTFSWLGSIGDELKDVEASVLKSAWRERHGPSYSFWMPSWKNDFVLAQDIQEGDTTILVKGIEFLKIYDRDCEDRKGRRRYIPELEDHRWRWTLYGLLLIHDSNATAANDRGDWANGVSYQVADLVTQGNTDYFCIQAHTSNTSNDRPGSGSNWQQFWKKFVSLEGEVRRFIPIGDPTVADDELNEGENQGAGAVTAIGSNTEIKLRLMAGEELPLIQASQVKLLSLVRHVRFSSKLLASYAADYTPRISSSVQQIYDEAIFAPELFATFELYDPDHPEGFAINYQARRIEGQTDLVVTVSLNEPAPRDGIKVAYKLSGDAKAGTHYNITAGASPLTFDKGETQKTITIQTPLGSEYFLERLLKIQLDMSNSSDLVKTTEADDEFRVYIAPDLGPNPPPVVDWTSSSSDWNDPGNGGTHSGAVATTTAVETQEDVAVWYEIDPASTAQEGDGNDYKLPLAPGERLILSSQGFNNATLPIEVLSTHTPGRTLILNLHYERASGEDRNNVCFSETLQPEDHDDGLDLPENVGTSKVLHVTAWPTGNNDGNYSHGPASAVKKGRVWPNTWFKDPEKKHPRNPNKPLEGFVVTKNAIKNGYVRNSAADEFNCDGEVQLYPLVDWQRWSFLVETPSASSPAPNGIGRYIRMSLRDRGWVGEVQTDISHIVIFDSNSNDGGLLGAPVITSTGRWGVLAARHEAGSNASDGDWETGTSYAVDDIVTHGDSMYKCKVAHTSNSSNEPGSGGSWETFWDLLAALYYGVDEVNGETRLWIIYFEGNQERITGAGHAGPSRSNRLFYQNNFDEANEEVHENLGEGVLIYDQLHELSSTDLRSEPINYWPRERSRHEPRGNAFLGSTTQHTITF